MFSFSFHRFHLSVEISHQFIMTRFFLTSEYVMLAALMSLLINVPSLLPKYRFLCAVASPDYGFDFCFHLLIFPVLWMIF